MTITLQQFERIDGLFRAVLARPEIDVVAKSPYATAAYIRDTYFRPEWKLLDACVEAIGYDAASAFADAKECAAHILTGCLTGKIETRDELAAA